VGHEQAIEGAQVRERKQISMWLTTILLNCARLQLCRRARHIHVSIYESSEELQPVSASERLADNRPNPDDQYRESERRERLTHFHRQLSPTLRMDVSVGRRGGFIDPRILTDVGSTKRHCESAVSTSSQESQRIDASHSQTAIPEAAKSNAGFRKFDTLAT
jgi:hypothetical protein